jgi:transaldolase/glucose-6-phosphate isomerase
LEQLVAESLGKNGRGIVPIINEPYCSPENYGSDRYFVAFILDADGDRELNHYLKRLEKLGHPTIRIYLEDKYGLAQEIFRWEVAVALAGSVIGVHPFNQPDVQWTKDLTKKVLEMDREIRKREEALETSRMNDPLLAEKIESWFSSGKTGDYVCIQAYLPPFSEIEEAVQKLRKRLLIRTSLASTFGFGPRYLHSTGQLHKGGPNSGLFLQLVDEQEFDLKVPETDCSFGSLIQAQALGDFQSLKERNRRVLRINLGSNALDSLHLLEKMF